MYRVVSVSPKISDWKLWKQSVRKTMAKKKSSTKNNKIKKCNKKNCENTCNKNKTKYNKIQQPVVSSPTLEVDIKPQSKTDVLLSFIKKLLWIS